MAKLPDDHHYAVLLFVVYKNTDHHNFMLSCHHDIDIDIITVCSTCKNRDDYNDQGFLPVLNFQQRFIEGFLLH